MKVLVFIMMGFAVCTAANNVFTLTIDDAHRVFTAYVGEVKQKLTKGELKQPDVQPPDKEEVFVERFGWIRPATLDVFLTLKPIELKFENEWLAYLMLGSDEYRDKDQKIIPTSVAVFGREDGQWKFRTFRSLGGKPQLTPTSPTNVVKPTRASP